VYNDLPHTGIGMIILTTAALLAALIDRVRPYTPRHRS
jgi:LPXTG cell wall anchor motif